MLCLFSINMEPSVFCWRSSETKSRTLKIDVSWPISENTNMLVTNINKCTTHLRSYTTVADTGYCFVFCIFISFAGSFIPFWLP